MPSTAGGCARGARVSHVSAHLCALACVHEHGGARVGTRVLMIQGCVKGRGRRGEGGGACVSKLNPVVAPPASATRRLSL